MRIKVNGIEEEACECSIHDFICKKGMDPESIVIEHNFNVLKREEWKNVQLKENDNLEILGFVGGG